MIESIGLAVEKTAEAAITASEVAELGAIKPDGFGFLIKEHLIRSVILYCHCKRKKRFVTFFYVLFQCLQYGVCCGFFTDISSFTLCFYIKRF